MRPLPDEAARLCHVLKAPDRLVSHLEVVHDVACHLVEGLRRAFPALAFDAEAVCFGAATHDLGKVIHPEELVGPGDLHEQVGPALLEANGVPPHLARFARTHGRWDREPVGLEDLLLALADHSWRAARNDGLEAMIVERLASPSGKEPWQTIILLDDVIGHWT